MTANHSRIVPLSCPLLLAAAMASLLGFAPPARAQFYDYSGEVGTFPFDFFPIDRSVSFYDMSGNSMVVGKSGIGSFSMFAGAWLKVDTLNLGSGGTANGDVSVSGASTRLELGGAGNYRLGIGNWGTGSMTVSAGALVDAALPPDGCAGADWWCGGIVGAGAGSTGTLTVTGGGSELRTLRSFVVGNSWVNAGFGTPGGTTHATVNVLDGGTLRTEQAVIGTVPGGPGSLGTEHVISNVTIDGAGSQWIVTRNSVDNTSAFLAMGTQANAQATISITGGGKLVVDGTGSIGPTDGLQLAFGGRADLTVSGVGSAVETKSVNPFINVGRSGDTGQATFSVLAGATATSMFLNVGRDLARGDLLIDGSGSQVTLSGVGTPGVGGAASASIGRDGGTGFATVSNGGRWVITDGGADSRPNASGPGISVGRGAGGSGSLSITGPGSTVEIVSTSLGLPTGVPDNYNAGFVVGNGAGSNGTLTVENGGKLLLTGNAVSTVADSRTTYLGIGGNSDSAAGGNGSAVVSGLGSEVRVSGSDAFISVGRGPGSTGHLNISDKGLVTATNMNVGRVGTGFLAMDNASIELSGQQTGNLLAGAALTIANRGGTGFASLANGSRVTITNLGTSGAGLYVGGSAPHPLGNGSLAMTGGSQIKVVASSGLGTLSVGHDGTGSVAMDQGSSIDIGNGSAYLGRTATGIGSVVLKGASSLNAGYVGIGATPGVDTGTGTLLVSDGSTVNASTVEIGARGLLGGNGGTINADVIIAGTVSPGESPGRIRFNGAVSAKPGGTLVLDILANGEDSFTAVARGLVNPQGVLTPGYDIDQWVIGAGSNFDFSGLTVAMNFLGTTNPTAFAESGALDLDNFVRSANGDIETGLSTVFPEGVHWTDVLAHANIVAWTGVEEYVGVELEFTGSSEGLTAVVTFVPEPATWAFMLLGLCLLGALARRQQRSARRA